MRTVERPWPQWCPRDIRAALAIALACSVIGAQPVAAYAAGSRYAFAVISGTLESPADEAPTQRLLDTIGRDSNVSFIVYDGNLKGARETCNDALYERRQTLLEAARPALIFVAGQHDWADCGTAPAGSYDPVERLDLLRQTVFADASSMGQNPVALTRESEVSRFHPYRENVRWQVEDTVFLALNVPSPNNHYLNAGGRNGEFEDRVVANAFWLEHAAEFAKRRGARAIVVFMQGDPDPERYERPDRFAWLRFARNQRRDGYLELKRSLVKLAQTFRGPILVVHHDDQSVPAGFQIDQPLRNDKGVQVTNLTRIAFAPRDRLNQWIEIDADTARRPPFRVSVRDVPKSVPMPAAAPSNSLHEEPVPSMPEIPSMPPASDLAPTTPLPMPQPAPGSGGNTGNGAGNSTGSTATPNMPPAFPAAPASSVQRGP
ncbi:hypothetical protein [Paraburkholderia saeva]|jgi:hypothetical protein|uniref:Uncharacterized protein n=1 Tax=Paraburkholderia saeva TaxID=2777537 RepID=A0A9N8X275_9BURK|nr:hypothetical protein [Paraburkholderia saeva]CAG4892455.1 hypothetical protein R70241_01341 [Paraburkholderia saeva]CAG4899154.1 hypothetical protein LMG31841_02726 [Paraburkholderia saeva]CAG4899706.1 hypothetical protein R52603_02637 [Paraburkholderia saeva]